MPPLIVRKEEKNILFVGGGRAHVRFDKISDKRQPWVDHKQREIPVGSIDQSTQSHG